MKPIEFPGHNVVFAKDQPEYQPLPAMRLPDGTVITCWELTDEDLETIKSTRRMYLSQLTFNQPLQPIFMTPDLSNIVTLTE